MSAHRARFGGEGARADFVPLRGWDRGAAKALLECVAPFVPEGRLCIEDIEEYARDALEFAERHLRKHGGADPHG
eukprot:COSAG04_NODE_609_length_12066_cov_55.131695_1_plen_74_part_10